MAGLRDSLCTAVDPQLSVNIAAMFLYCVQGDDQLFSDLLVRITISNQAQYLQFSFAQRFDDFICARIGLLRYGNFSYS